MSIHTTYTILNNAKSILLESARRHTIHVSIFTVTGEYSQDWLQY